MNFSNEVFSYVFKGTYHHYAIVLAGKSIYNRSVHFQHLVIIMDIAEVVVANSTSESW